MSDGGYDCLICGEHMTSGDLFDYFLQVCGKEECSAKRCTPRGCVLARRRFRKQEQEKKDEPSRAT